MSRKTSAATAPITANWRRWIGFTSGLAPESTTTLGLGGVGQIEAIDGLFTPEIRPMWMMPAAIAAPVDPAERNPAASPDFTIRAAIDTDALGFSLIARAGSSRMPMTSGAWTMGREAPSLSR